MRFPAAAISAAALLAGSVNADAQSVLSEASSSVSSVASDASSVVESATSGPELPTFTPTAIKGDFVEQFTDDWDARWKPSHAKKDTKGSAKEDEEWAYVGEWAVEEPHVYKGMEGDKGLVVKNAAAHHAISAKFPKKIDNKGKTLVVQYEVKLQNGLECGGAYLKLLRDNKALHQDEFSNVSPYVVMFGPDKCGTTNKVHFIVNHKNPKTGEYEEKHLSAPPAARIVKTSELYTLIVHPNNTVHIKLNGEQVKEANLLEDFLPPFNPPAEIDDPKDSKPDTWIDEARIADPKATKPEDWDEDAPFEIVDEEATIPEDWLETEPLTVPDPEASKPEDWDEEEDGDWVAPTVPNPKCDDVSGCGKWEKPTIKNPAFKGKWTAPYIDNLNEPKADFPTSPAYKGVWAPRKIKNPAFFEDKTPANLEPMGAIGFEIWTMQNDILFDNIYIGHSIADAEKFAQETFFEKHPIEQLVELAEKPKVEDKPKSPSDLVFLDDPILYVKEKLDLFFTIAQNDPIQAVKFVPEAAGGIAAVLVTLIAIIVGVVSMGGSTPPQVKKAADKAKATATDAKDKVAEAVSTGAEKAQDATKRATRSSS
ncbi:Calnexin-like protein [Lachnellula subtilissima]|uniref:Calnexin-like protein n=1 Tax=Lachnellula subtilissima TaxID=602034 RepID=A0A8H8RX58_9HELO|nr:Calnexin-like protein [Lachnellula subtilissima]